MKTLTEASPILKEQVKQGIYKNEEEAFIEHQIAEERKIKRLTRNYI